MIFAESIDENFWWTSINFKYFVLEGTVREIFGKLSRGFFGGIYGWIFRRIFEVISAGFFERTLAVFLNVSQQESLEDSSCKPLKEELLEESPKKSKRWRHF